MGPSSIFGRGLPPRVGYRWYHLAISRTVSIPLWSGLWEMQYGEP
jgi:hypothetical protein